MNAAEEQAAHVACDQGVPLRPALTRVCLHGPGAFSPLPPAAIQSVLPKHFGITDIAISGRGQ